MNLVADSFSKSVCKNETTPIVCDYHEVANNKQHEMVQDYCGKNKTKICGKNLEMWLTRNIIA